MPLKKAKQQQTQEQEPWHDRFAAYMQRLASLEAENRMSRSSLEQALQANARLAQMQSRLEERLGAAEAEILSTG